MGELFPRRLIEQSRHPALFLRLLARYPEHCARYALPLDPGAAVADPTAFARALGRLVNAPPREQPAALREQLSAVAAVAGDDEGYVRLRRVLEEHAPEREIPAGLSPVDLTLWASEEDPEAIAHAHARKRKDRLRAYREFLPVRFAELTPARLDAATRRLGRDVTDHPRRGGLVRIAAIELEARRRGVRIHVLRGRPVRADGVDDDDDDGDGDDLLPYGPDAGWIDHQTGRLSLHAPSDEVDDLRGLLGRALFDDEGHYGRTAIYSAQPLLDRGAAALACDGIGGLRSIRLVGLRFLTARRRSRDPESVTWRSGDVVASQFNDPHSLSTLRNSPGVLSMHFVVQLSGVTGTRRVRVHMPNRFDFDPKVDDAPVRAFLEARGFADYGAEWKLAA